MTKRDIMTAILITSLIVVLPIAYGQSIQITISNSGIIVKNLEIGIYSDEDCITPSSSLDGVFVNLVQTKRQPYISEMKE